MEHPRQKSGRAGSRGRGSQPGVRVLPASVAMAWREGGFPFSGGKRVGEKSAGADTFSTRSRGPGLSAGLQVGTQSEREGATPSGDRGARGAELAQPLSLSLPLSLNCPRASPALPLALQGSAHSSAHPCASLRTSPHPPRIPPHLPGPLRQQPWRPESKPRK